MDISVYLKQIQSKRKWAWMMLVWIMAFHVQSCKSQLPTHYAEAIQSPGIHVLYNSLIQGFPMMEYYGGAEFPPTVYAPAWKTWIVDERNVEFALDWMAFSQEDYYQRNGYRLKESPGYLQITSEQHSMNAELVTITVKQLPDIAGLPVICVSAKTSSKYGNENAKAYFFTKENAHWKIIDKDVLLLPPLAEYFPHGTDLTQIQHYDMVSLEFDIDPTQLRIGVRAFNEHPLDCQDNGQYISDIPAEYIPEICETMAHLSSKAIVYIWNNRRQSFMQE